MVVVFLMVKSHFLVHYKDDGHTQSMYCVNLTMGWVWGSFGVPDSFLNPYWMGPIKKKCFLTYRQSYV